MDKPSPALRGVLTELHTPRPWIYWVDLVASASVGWLALWVTVRFSILAAPIGALALLRATYFIHELAHVQSSKLPGFSFAWHVLVGIPMLVPSLMIGAHSGHHRTTTYGTAEDPEYLPYAHWPRWRLVLEVLFTAVVPPLLALRWAVIGPLSWLLPPLRRVTIARFSTLATNPRFVRSAEVDGAWVLQEVVLALWVWTIALTASLRLMLAFLLVTGLALVINQVRTLVAHAYENAGGEPLDVDGQLGDTLTLGGGLLTELVAPLGDRFHAAHHRFPAMPYHNLGHAHRLLLADEGLGVRYRATERRGVLGALRRLFG